MEMMIVMTNGKNHTPELIIMKTAWKVVYL